MNTKHLTIFITLSTVLLLLLPGCGPKALQETERDAILAFSEAKTDNLMQAFNGNDYAAFSKDFDQALLKAMTESAFQSLYSQLQAKIGNYVSREVDDVLTAGDFITVVYLAKFSDEEIVQMRVVFTVAEEHLVTGLWFDSPKLRQ